METIIMNVPKGNGKQADETVQAFMALIPFGEENAINRKHLVSICNEIGLIEEHCKDKDRAMRILLQKAKLDYAICNAGKGYFRPLPKNMHTLKICIEKERKRAMAIFGSLKSMEKLYEDYNRERITERE